MTIFAPHLRQRIFASRLFTLSSAIEYLALHDGQEIFTLHLSNSQPAAQAHRMLGRYHFHKHYQEVRLPRRMDLLVESERVSTVELFYH